VSVHGRTLRAALLALGVAWAAAACGGDAGGRDGTVQVGLVLSTGGRGDKGFNDAALAGLRRAASELKADTAVSEKVDDEARSSELARYATEKRDLVIGISFMTSGPAFELAQRHADVNFAVLDYSPVLDDKGQARTPPPNLAGITYRAEEGAFLAGALAGLKTATRRVGFVGGMSAPVIRSFEAGYTAGVKAVCPDCDVLVGYAGDTPAAFNDPARGKALATEQYAAGADVIFHASGATGSGVFEAAVEQQKWVIGVDVDQSDQAPGRVLTSVTKNLDVSVYGLVQQQREGRFHGGVISQGLAEGAMGWVYNESNRALVPAPVFNRVETLRQAIIAGLIKVPRVPADRVR
jgi:basic membrane protein A